MEKRRVWAKEAPVKESATACAAALQRGWMWRKGCGPESWRRKYAHEFEISSHFAKEKWPRGEMSPVAWKVTTRKKSGFRGMTPIRKLVPRRELYSLQSHPKTPSFFLPSCSASCCGNGEPTWTSYSAFFFIPTTMSAATGSTILVRRAICVACPKDKHAKDEADTPGVPENADENASRKRPDAKRHGPAARSDFASYTSDLKKTKNCRYIYYARLEKPAIISQESNGEIGIGDAPLEV